MIPSTITDPPKHVRDLHAHYCARSGIGIMYNMFRENTWKEWLQFCAWAWGKDEISMVIFYLREEIGRQKRNEGALKFSNLIGDPVKFEEDLGLARKDGRARASIAKPKAPTPAAPVAPEDEKLTGAEAVKSFAELLRQK